MANGMDHRIARALDAHLRGRGGFGVQALAELMGRPGRTIHNWCEAVCSPSAADLFLVIDAVRSQDPARATLLLADLVRVVGHTVTPVDLASDPDPLPVDVMQAAATEGDLAREVASHGETTDPYEARRALPFVRRLAAAVAVIAGKLEALAATGPQRVLPGVGR